MKSSCEVSWLCVHDRRFLLLFLAILKLILIQVAALEGFHQTSFTCPVLTAQLKLTLITLTEIFPCT